MSTNKQTQNWRQPESGVDGLRLDGLALDGLGLPDPYGVGLPDAYAAGLPDAATLSRLANQFFTTIPGADWPGAEVIRSIPGPTGVAIPAGIPGTLTAAPAQFVATEYISPRDLPGRHAEFESLADLGKVGIAPDSVAPTEIAGGSYTRGIPGGVSAGDFSSVPSFSFIEDARSLFAGAPAVPVQALPIPAPVTIASQENPHLASSGILGAVPKSISSAPPGSFTGAIPANGIGIDDVGAPQIGGAVANVARPVNFGFLDLARPLGVVNVVPTLEPDDASKHIPAASNISSSSFDVAAIRRDFPILQERVNGRPLIWLDNAATTQKPNAVIDRLNHYYRHENSNVHRAAHEMAARSTDAYEGAREKVRRFLNAGSAREIIFVRGATEGINLVAQSWGRRNIQKDDEIVITWLEHHANIVPWQMLCAEKGARLRVAPVDDSGQIILEEYEKLLNPRTRLVAVPHVSNALGTITPVNDLIEAAHRHGAKVLVDGAQAVSHLGVDVQALDCDFYIFSGHKIFAPTGIGVVFGKQEVLDATPPWQGGGNMIADVTFEKTVYQPAPGRFEAGTGSIADAVGLGAALDYLTRIGMANIARYEHDLLQYGMESLKRIPGLHLLGTAREKASVLSFVLDGFRNEDIGAALNKEGIAVRSGHHCAQPIHRRFGLESSVRPSLAFYNTCEEIDALVAAIWNLKSGRGAGHI